MKRKSTNYSTADGGGWRNACDDLFLAGFRGRPCEICGKTKGWDGREIRSCGHHLAEKGLHRNHRYNPALIIVLCPEHHSRFSRSMSPHADDTAAVARFYDWLRVNKPEQYDLLNDVKNDKFNKEWTYREMYERLGGEILKEKDGKKIPMKDWKPKNHARKVKEIENGNG